MSTHRERGFPTPNARKVHPRTRAKPMKKKLPLFHGQPLFVGGDTYPRQAAWTALDTMATLQQQQHITRVTVTASTQQHRGSSKHPTYTVRSKTYPVLPSTSRAWFSSFTTLPQSRRHKKKRANSTKTKAKHTPSSCQPCSRNATDEEKGAGMQMAGMCLKKEQ